MSFWSIRKQPEISHFTCKNTIFFKLNIRHQKITSFLSFPLSALPPACLCQNRRLMLKSDTLLINMMCCFQFVNKSLAAPLNVVVGFVEIARVPRVRYISVLVGVTHQKADFVVLPVVKIIIKVSDIAFIHGNDVVVIDIVIGSNLACAVPVVSYAVALKCPHRRRIYVVTYLFSRCGRRCYLKILR